MNEEIYDIALTSIDGTRQSMDVYRGRVLLVVNVASACGYTPQYEGLEALYRQFRDRGFTVLGFPCDQFGRQEPGTDADIQKFCTLTYDVTFPMFAKTKVNGDGAHPLFKYLKSQKKGFLGMSSVKWNFSKFLVGSEGAVLKRYGAADTPAAIALDVETALDSAGVSAA